MKKKAKKDVNLNMKITADEMKQIKKLADKLTRGNVTLLVIESVLKRKNEKED